MSMCTLENNNLYLRIIYLSDVTADQRLVFFINILHSIIMFKLTGDFVPYYCLV